MPPRPTGPNTQQNELMLIAQQLMQSGKFASMEAAAAYVRSNPAGARAALSARPPQSRPAPNDPTVPGNTQRPPITGAQDPNSPAYTGPAGTGSSDGELRNPPQGSNGPNANWQGRNGVVNPPQRAQAGIQGDPGPERRGPQDQYGAGMRQNTNQAGVQSNGDDDPWSIGAFNGGTYDPKVMSAWVQRAQQGDPQAAHVLSQIGYEKGMSGEQWAASRQLATRDEGFGASGKWYTQPQGAPQAGAQRQSMQPPQAAARDQGLDGLPASWGGGAASVPAPQGKQSASYTDDGWGDIARGAQSSGAPDPGLMHQAYPGAEMSPYGPDRMAGSREEHESEKRNEAVGLAAEERGPKGAQGFDADVFNSTFNDFASQRAAPVDDEPIKWYRG